jgi:hypothetical protein
VRYQYEITEDVTAVTSAGLAGVLPALESAIASAMLPVFFGEECLDDGGSTEGDDGTVTEEGEDEDENGGGTRRRRRRRGLRGTMGLRAGDTAKVVGIDSRPEDFPLYDRGERPDRTDRQENCCLFPPPTKLAVVLHPASLAHVTLSSLPSLSLSHRYYSPTLPPRKKNANTPYLTSTGGVTSSRGR